MSEERRKADRRIPPSVAQHAIEERAELLARIEEQAREIERLKRSAQTNWNEFAEGMKAQPSGAVLPEPFDMRPFQTVDQGSTNFKAGFNAALRKVRESLNSPSVIVGVVDERAIDAAMVEMQNISPPLRRSDCARLIRAALTAQPDHSAQSEVPDGWRRVKVGAEGAQFGNAWFSHEGITGYTAEQLNSGSCRVTGRAYMEWLAAAPTPGKEIE